MSAVNAGDNSTVSDGDDLIAIPRHYNMRGFYGHEDDPAIDTFYVKKNGSSLWQKYSTVRAERQRTLLGDWY